MDRLGMTYQRDITHEEHPFVLYSTRANACT